MAKPLPFDELPLWSAPFGLTLLETIRIKQCMNILDIGSGTGFPMLEIAERAGGSSMVYGVDPDADANTIINKKAALLGVENVRIVNAVAENLPFPDNHFGLIVANNGLNNVQDAGKALAECFRVCQPDGQMVLTMNLPHTMTEFYEVYEEVLLREGLMEEVRLMKQHIEKLRKPVEQWTQLIETAGFTIRSVQPDGFKIRFINGTAMLNHSFIRNHFMKPWQQILPPESVEPIFMAIEEILNNQSMTNGELTLSIPYACYDCQKAYAH